MTCIIKMQNRCFCFITFWMKIEAKTLEIIVNKFLLSKVSEASKLG